MNSSRSMHATYHHKVRCSRTFMLVLYSLLASTIMLVSSAIADTQSSVSSASSSLTGKARPLNLYGNKALTPLVFEKYGVANGVAVDILNEALSRADINARLLTDVWSDAQQRVDQGQADGLFYVNKNPERVAKYRFSEPLMDAEFVMFTRNDSALQSGSKVLDSYVVGIERKGYAEGFVMQYDPTNILRYKDLNAAMRALSMQDVDVVFADKWAGLHALVSLQLDDITVAGSPLERSPTYVAVLPEHAYLLPALNSALASMREDGTLDDIKNSWSGEAIVFLRADEYNFMVYASLSAVLLLSILFLGHYITAARRLNTVRKALGKATVQLKDVIDSKDQLLGSRLQFLANVSHEIRTPLNGIYGAIQLLSQSKHLDITDKSNLTIGQSAADSLLASLDQIMDASALYSDALEVKLSKCNLFDLLKKVADEQKVLASRKDLYFNANIASQLADFDVLCDERLLSQAIEQIVNNAIKFTQVGEVDMIVDLNLRSDGNVGIKFLVRDTGEGVPDSVINNLNEPFYVVDNSHSRAQGGLGLGLSVAYKVIELMGGKLHIENRRSNGSEFTFSLVFAEISKAYMNVPAPVTELYAVANEQHQPFVLIVEDNEINATLLMSMLDQYDVRYMWAKNGEEAVEATQKRLPSLVLMDLQMPLMDGLEATSLIRKWYDKRELPIVAVTASTFDADILSTHRAGMNEHINKPVSIEIIETIMKKYCAIDRGAA